MMKNDREEISPTNMQDSIVILGAGVIGLDVALILAEKGYGRHTTIIAQHLPGDTSIKYTSPWAGANFSAISGSDKNALIWDKAGYKRLMKLAATDGAAAAIRKTKSFEYWDEKPAAEKLDSLADYLEDVILSPDKLLPGTEYGISFTTVTINAPQHILYLKSHLESQGVKFLRRKLEHLDSAFLSERTKVVFNCIGNAARNLPGVQDENCFPVRGQILLARAPQITQNIMRHGRDYETYIIPRPFSNGNVVLGGFMQKNNGTGDTFAHEMESIWTRTTALEPLLDVRDTEILATFAGLRPGRLGGARIEAEARSGGRVVVHNYGAGGTGYQAGFGMAMEAVELAGPYLKGLTGGADVGALGFGGENAMRSRLPACVAINMASRLLEQHKTLLERLYIHDDLKVKDIVEYMRENHKEVDLEYLELNLPSVGAYQRTFRKWGFKKNRNHSHWGWVDKKRRGREALGKQTRFTYNNHVVDDATIRKNISRNVSTAQQITTVTTPGTPDGWAADTPTASTPGCNADIDPTTHIEDIAQVEVPVRSIFEWNMFCTRWARGHMPTDRTTILSRYLQLAEAFVMAPHATSIPCVDDSTELATALQILQWVLFNDDSQFFKVIQGITSIAHDLLGTTLFLTCKGDQPRATAVMWSYSVRPNSTDANGVLCFIVASCHDLDKIAWLLLQSGAKVDMPRTGYTVWSHMCRCQRSHDAVGSILSEACAKKDYSWPGRVNFLYGAVICGHLDIMQVMRESGIFRPIVAATVSIRQRTVAFEMDPVYAFDFTNDEDI
ncbi:D-amino-acid oxidase [Pyrenophora seminiperda CCB06]|uniref:D-amino-acid oxidase n=1 Tax=Pyrenophora seminiperda CCB06 TaxID=1302712 RepID=A0A3M7MGW2_9PLEO|nr:D-amino-acid oxidase [Pyrenophora seminiperda CCB06]